MNAIATPRGEVREFIAGKELTVVALIRRSPYGFSGFVVRTVDGSTRLVGERPGEHEEVL
jgi:hypothetical protein